MKRTSFLLLAVLSGVGVFAQPNVNKNAHSKPVTTVSPDAASLGKYGTYEVNHYTGAPNISIPIYELTESGISVPISISYDASGFIPNKNNSQVGQNWNLSAGGAITRTVRGVPDDKYTLNLAYQEGLTRDNIGYISGMNRNPNTRPTATQVEQLQFLEPNTGVTFLTGIPQIVDPIPGSSNYMYHEYNPDIFSFNFLGHSGTFVMGNDGNIKVSSDRVYTVDISLIGETYDLATTFNQTAQYNGLVGTTSTQYLANKIFSIIKITSDDGVIFEFGGRLCELEVSFNYQSYDSRDVIGTSGVINAWYLTKITIPGADPIKFEYKNYSLNEVKILQNLNSIGCNFCAQNDADFLDIKLFWKNQQTEYSLNNGSFTLQQSNQFPTPEKSLVKLVYLTKIDSKLKKVLFQYSRRNEEDVNEFYTGDPDNWVDKNAKYFTKKLDQIIVSDAAGAIAFFDDGDALGSPLFIYDLIYQFYGDELVGHRLFLKELRLPTSSKYEFEYWRTGDLKHPLNMGIDKWGYYNGQPNSYLIGVTTSLNDPEFETNFSQSGRDRNPNPSVVDIGLLKFVTFPTGGKTKFEYEAHDYRKLLKRKVSQPTTGNTFIPQWVPLTQNAIAGGARIRKISSEAPGIAGTQVTEYKYIKDYDLNQNGPSSGRLISEGVYRVRYERPGGDFLDQLYDDNLASASSVSESHICYTEVVEIKGDGTEGFTKLTFVNPDNEDYQYPNSSPDNYELSSYPNIRILSKNYNITSWMNQMKRLARSSSLEKERGKVWKKEIYNSSNTKIKSEEYKYNRDPNRLSNNTVGYQRTYDQKIELDGNSDFGFFVQTFRIYHYHNQPSEIIEKTYANGQTLTQTTTFTYKSNSRPLLTEKTLTKSDGSIFKTKYFYAEDRLNDPEFPASMGMYSAHVFSPVVEEQTFRNNTPLETVRNIYEAIPHNMAYKIKQTKTINHLIGNASSQIRNNFTYYRDGNVRESYNENDLKTAYIWDYKKTLPIAVVTNVGSADDIAYSSFETTEEWTGSTFNQWTYNILARIPSFQCPTGGRVYDLNYNSTAQNITRALNPSKEYVLSLWANGTVNVNSLSGSTGETIGNWTYKEYSITGTSLVTISGTGKVDELRLYPKNAFMTTYTYMPLSGMTSQCDQNNRITYYSYDFAGRLLIVRDKDRRVLKKYCYNLNNATENCISYIFRNSVASQSFTKNDCEEGYEGTSVTYTVPAGTYTSDTETGADQRAQQDIGYNGQNYANANGSCICTSNSCSAVDKKCVNGVCETAVRKNISTTFNKGTGLWTCVYVYQWSDCSESQQYSEQNTSACTVAPAPCDL